MNSNDPTKYFNINGNKFWKNYQNSRKLIENFPKK